MVAWKLVTCELLWHRQYVPSPMVAMPFFSAESIRLGSKSYSYAEPWSYSPTKYKEVLTGFNVSESEQACVSKECALSLSPVLLFSFNQRSGEGKGVKIPVSAVSSALKKID